MSKRVKSLFFTLFILAIGFGQARNEKSATEEQSTMAYYQQCLKRTTDPAVLAMADTLYHMAGRQADNRMQAVALCTKLDYYYFNNRLNNQYDSIQAWVERVQDFAKATAQPKYYYFVWGSRLINYHLIRKEYNIALTEAEKMLNEAKADDYKEAIADCYSVLCNIYTGKGLADQAYKFALSEIELFEKYKLDRYNISMKYGYVGTRLSDEGKFEQAEAYFDDGQKHAHTSYHHVNIKLHRARNHIQNNKLQQAYALINQARHLFTSDASLNMQREMLHRTEVGYYMTTKEYTKALQAVNLWEEAIRLREMKTSVAELYEIKADIYWEMGRKAEAAEIYRQIIDINKQERTHNEEIATAEIATLLNVHKLNAEKKELETLGKERQLQYTRSLLILLSALLIIVFVFLYRQRRMNVRLKRSRDKLDEKNRILLKAEEELRRAKDIAERNSRMKDVFIQNISHEIRTPLNSIVGFSTILTELCPNDEVKVYAETIDKNSQLLLTMITDIIELSDLDQSIRQVRSETVSVNECGHSSIEITAPLVANGVKINFNPLPGDPVISTDRLLVIQVLRNLLNNAAKFTTTGKISLTLQEDKKKKELRFIVTDTGIGIPNDKQEMVFDRFVKLDEFSQGAGLGLSIARLSAEKLGGYLTIDDTYTRGARFIFGIPVR